MRQRITIIDDFLDSPYKLRKEALGAEYAADDGKTYPGKNSLHSHLTEEILSKSQFVFGKELVPSKGSACGQFRLSLANDSFLQDVHVDNDTDIAGVLYLNSPQHCIPEAGTSFWRHNKLQMDRCPENLIEGKCYGFTEFEEIYNEIICKDGLDRSLWTRYAYAPMKYNRVVFFDPLLWHSHGDNFGTNLQNGRLVMVLFFDFKK